MLYIYHIYYWSFDGWYRSCVSWRTNASHRRWLPSSAVCWQSNMPSQEITQPVRWPLFCHCQANTVEQSAWIASATRHHLRTIQTIVENIYMVSWAKAPWVWTLRALTRNLLTYLLTTEHYIQLLDDCRKQNWLTN